MPKFIKPSTVVRSRWGMLVVEVEDRDVACIRKIKWCQPNDVLGFVKYLRMGGKSRVRDNEWWSDIQDFIPDSWENKNDEHVPTEPEARS